MTFTLRKTHWKAEVLLSPIYSPPNLSIVPCLNTALWPQQEVKKKNSSKAAKPLVLNLQEGGHLDPDFKGRTQSHMSSSCYMKDTLSVEPNHILIQVGTRPPQHVTSREKCFVNSAAAVIHAPMSLQHLTSWLSFTKPLILLELRDTQFWLLAYNVSPHVAPE